MDTLETINLLIELSDKKTKIYSGHTADELLPLLAYSDMIDLANVLKENHLKSGLIPKYKKINEKMSIIY